MPAFLEEELHKVAEMGLQPKFTAPTLLNSWVNYGSGYAPVGFYRDPLAKIYLRGRIKSGTATAGTVLFTLPSAYRPSGRLSFSVASNGAFGQVDVLTNGDVTIQVGSNTWLALDGIQFPAI